MAAVQILLFFSCFFLGGMGGGGPVCVMHCRWLGSGIQMRHKDTGRSFPGGKPVETSAPCGHMMVEDHHARVVFDALSFGGGWGRWALSSGRIPRVEPHANVTVPTLKGQSVYL